MTWMARISLIVCVLVSVSLIAREAFAQNTENRRRIVIFQPGTTLTAALNLVENTKVLGGLSSKLVHNLWLLINGLAIELPSIGTQVVEDLLKANKLLVEGVYDDTVAIVDGGSRCVKIVPALQEELPVPQKYTWNMVTIAVPAVHPQRQGSGVRVAVLDTGIASHLELSGPIERYNARYGEKRPNVDENGHGTHMAGIIASELNNLVLGVIGVAPQATLLAVKVLDQYGAGYLSDVVNGMQLVYNNGSPLAKVVNMSIGWSTDSPPLKKAIHELDKEDVIMVASAGNSCPNSQDQDEGNGDECDGGPQLACDTAVKYPAAYDEVMAVEATNNLDQTADYSLSGDVAAPGGSKTTGVRILSTTTGGYGYGSGTSQAAAHVTGAVALALQLDSGLSFEDVRLCLQATAVKATPEAREQINVYNMVQALLAGQCP